MTDILKLFDPYSRQARLYPALLMLLPILFTALAWFPALLTTGQVLVTIVVSCGLLFLLADLARSQGKRIEPILLEEWGGWPTTAWLRHSDSHLSGLVKQRYHAFLGRQAALGPMPSPAEEVADPKAADERYASAVVWLKEQCRGPHFPLVERENAIYGFRRNMLGLKPIAASLCIIAFLFPALLALTASKSLANVTGQVLGAYVSLQPAMIGVLFFSLLALVGWMLVVNRRGVRAAADQYARALLAGCDSLTS